MIKCKFPHFSAIKIFHSLKSQLSSPENDATLLVASDNNLISTLESSIPQPALAKPKLPDAPSLHYVVSKYVSRKMAPSKPTKSILTTKSGNKDSYI